MAGVSYWEGLLEEEIKTVGRVLEGVRKTKTAHTLSSALVVERRLGYAFEYKQGYREELRTSTTLSEKDRKHHTNRLQQLDQQLLVHQINWDLMSTEATEAHKAYKKRKEQDEASVADSTSTGWTASTAWTALTGWSAGSSHGKSSTKTPKTNANQTLDKASNKKTSKKTSKPKSSPSKSSRRKSVH